MDETFEADLYATGTVVDVVSTSQGRQTTHVEVTMLMECVAATQQAPAEMQE
jgi:hypothetical protein